MNEHEPTESELKAWHKAQLKRAAAYRAAIAAAAATKSMPALKSASAHTKTMRFADESDMAELLAQYAALKEFERRISRN